MKQKMAFVIVAVAALVASAADAWGQDRLIQQTKDPATGAVARLYMTNSGPRLEVESATVSVRKQVVNGRIITRLNRGAESLVIEQGDQTLSVAASKERVVVSANDEAGLARAKRLVAESPLAARAATLLGRITQVVAPTMQPILLTTRALLLEAKDDDSGTLELKQWIRNLRMRQQTVKTGGGQKTATECWKVYGDDLLAAYDDYIECLSSLKWWQIDGGVSRCAVLFELRILAAGTWYASCVSFGWLFGK